jgi:hypothetical protein
MGMMMLQMWCCPYAHAPLVDCNLQHILGHSNYSLGRILTDVRKALAF